MNRRIALLLYALGGGVVWWIVHLVGLSVLARPSCLNDRSWTLHALTAVTALGVASAIWASIAVRADSSAAALATGRARFLGDIAILFNVISLALIFLEGLPPVFMGTCR